MKLPFFIARRYFFAKRSAHVINLISLMSLLGVLVGSGALILILSVFNGFEHLVLSMQQAFHPEIKIEARAGKFFDPSIAELDVLYNDRDIERVVHVLEENALFRFQDRQHVGRVKGVSPEFMENTSLDSMMVYGMTFIGEDSAAYGVVGLGVQYLLAVNLAGGDNAISVYMPRSESALQANYQNAFRVKHIYPVGSFAVSQEIDEKYMLAPLNWTRELLGEPILVSSLELQLSEDADPDKVQKRLQSVLDDSFRIRNRVQQNPGLYKVLNAERLAVFLILLFVVIIAIFNIMGSMTMLVINKRKDVAVLQSLGANLSTIRAIFMTEGLMITQSGLFAGVFLGGLLAVLQQEFGLIQAQGLIVEAYPVRVNPMDFVWVIISVSVVGIVASWFAARFNVHRLPSVSEAISEVK